MDTISSRAQRPSQPLFDITVSPVAVIAWTALTLGLLATPALAGDLSPEDVKQPANAAVTASGLASQVLVEGTGEKPDPNDLVAVHFIGRTPDGKQFQNTYDVGKHQVFNLTQVFPGWSEGILLMQVGEKRRLWIPPHLAPPNPRQGPRGAVVFDVELLGVNPVPNMPSVEPPEDAVRLLSGSYTKRLETGFGEVFPHADSNVMVHYTGWTKDGAVFESSKFRGRPTLFMLGMVMAPFSDAVQQMVEGEKRLIWVPGNLVGGQWPGNPQGDLVFEVELLQIMPDNLFNEPGTGAQPQGGAPAPPTQQGP